MFDPPPAPPAPVDDCASTLVALTSLRALAPPALEPPSEELQAGDAASAPTRAVRNKCPWSVEAYMRLVFRSR